MSSVVVYGASGYGRSLGLGINAAERYKTTSVYYVDDAAAPKGEIEDCSHVYTFADWIAGGRDGDFIIGIGNPATRRMLVDRVRLAGRTFANLYRRGHHRYSHVEIGDGSVVNEMAYIGFDVRIAEHVHVMPMCSIGHDVNIDDYVTISPGCIISGYVNIGAGAVIGAGAIIVHGTVDRPLLIGGGAKIAAGSVITKSVKPGESVSGNPAISLREQVDIRRILRSKQCA
jgi:sugar O-acyltransferase (sialic acid O-acetyltransferase NeuD family)